MDIGKVGSLEKSKDVFENSGNEYSKSICKNDIVGINKADLKKKTGRTPGLTLVTNVTYNDKEYIVVGIEYKTSVKYFVCDTNVLDCIQERNWHISSGKYIGTNINLRDGTIKEVYIHNYIMKNTPEIDGVVEEKRYVVHINKNTFDNRFENLRIVNEDELKKVKGKRKRTSPLPIDSGICIDDIPRYVMYIKPSGNHGGRFMIEIPRLNICWKGSSSIKKSLREKYDEALKMLEEIKIANPELEGSQEDRILIERLNNDFDVILKLGNIYLDDIS